MKQTLKKILNKTCVLAALPLILSLAAVPAAYAWSPRSDWPGAGAIPRGSYPLGSLSQFRRAFGHAGAGEKVWATRDGPSLRIKRAILSRTHISTSCDR